jgi:serine/threonine protein kinase
VLLEPLGRGGFGEVWKCVAPGGLHKAIKFVGGSSGRPSDGAQLRQELEAFEQVKAIRHPFLLSLERVELVNNELVMVMALADRHLGERFAECRSGGLAGIPRDELIGYLREAAEALDVISAKHNLQHLDVKPANLFLTAGHVQVGDYGLVSKLDSGTGGEKNRGLTPRYAAPEVLLGSIHTRSDQYSLALVYQELLTGTFPYSGRGPQQIMLQHVSAVPDLTGLPDSDRPAVGRALAKRPEERFASCREFLDALARATGPPTGLAPGPSEPTDTTPAPPRSVEFGGPPTPGPACADEPTQWTGPARPAVPRPSSKRFGRTGPVPSASGQAPRPPTPVTPPGVQLRKILSVLPVGWLRGHEAPAPDLPPTDLIRAVVTAARATAGDVPEPVGEIRVVDNVWQCRFLTTVDPRIARVKLDLLWEEGGVSMDARDPNRVVFCRPGTALAAATKRSGPSGKKPDSGLEVVVEFPERTREVAVSGRVFGTPPPEFAQGAEKTIVDLLHRIRDLLNNFKERRKHPRLPADFPVTVFPMHRDGQVETPSIGRCRDVSQGGLALRTDTLKSSDYLYVTFEGVPGTTGLAILVQIVRRQRDGDGTLITGCYRTDLWPRATS